MAEKTKKQKRSRTSPLAEMVLKMIDGLPTRAASNVIAAFDEMPYVVKDALDGYYHAVDTLDGEGGTDAVKAALAELKRVCEANPAYEGLYAAAKEEANQGIAELYANGGMSL